MRGRCFPAVDERVEAGEASALRALGESVLRVLARREVNVDKGPRVRVMESTIRAMRLRNWIA